MCGAYYLIKSPKLRERLGISSLDDLKNQLSFFTKEAQQPQLSGLDWSHQINQGIHLFRPTDQVPFFFSYQHQIRWVVATHWWLILEQQGQNWVPNTKWASFNSKIDKLIHSTPKKTMHQIPPFSFRVLIPADGFIEWQPYNNKKRPLSLSHEQSRPMLLGGVAKMYGDQDSPVFSCSIITLPGHPNLAHIHKKSVPLIIQPEEIEDWLNPDLPTEHFQYLAETRLTSSLSVREIDMNNKVVGEPIEVIEA